MDTQGLTRSTRALGIVVAVAVVLGAACSRTPRVATINSVASAKDGTVVVIAGTVEKPGEGDLQGLGDGERSFHGYYVKDATGRVVVMTHSSPPPVGALVHVQGSTQFWGSRTPVVLPNGALSQGDQQMVFEMKRW